MKRFLAFFLVLFMIIPLVACNENENASTETTVTEANTLAEQVEEIEDSVVYEDTFTGLCEYLVENGSIDEINENIIYTISFELEDFYALGEVKISAIASNEAEEYKSICIQGGTLHYPNKSKDYAKLIISADGTYTFENDFHGQETRSIFTYETSVNANQYTNETELVCLRYNADTGELLKKADSPEINDYGRNQIDLNNLLNRAAIALAPVGLSTNSLGFTSYEPDMEQAKKNKNVYDMQIEWQKEANDKNNTKKTPPPNRHDQK